MEGLSRGVMRSNFVFNRADSGRVGGLLQNPHIDDGDLEQDENGMVQ